MDELIMRKALDLAKKGEGKVNPNPLVGAILVKDGKIIGQGFHEKFGGNHAEVNAINSCKEEISRSVLYVTLEPCCHYGKTPPCADLIIKNNIKKVVIGTLDPNPLVCGKGVKKLKEAGVEVKVGVLEEECKNLNEIFNYYILNKKPFVILKGGMTLDGKIATKIGESKWITNEKARYDGHKLRNKVSGIMVGIETILKDNPFLNCRIRDGVNPIKIILDSSLRIPINSNVINNAEKIIVATTKKANKEKIKELESLGVEVLLINSYENRVDLKELIEKLGEMNIDSILIEGGSTLNYSALNSNIVNKIKLYIAPIILGGEESKGLIGGQGVEYLKDSFKLNKLTFEKIEDNLAITAYLKE